MKDWGNEDILDTVEYYAAIRTDWISQMAVTGRHLVKKSTSEEKDIYQVTSLICGLERGKLRTWTVASDGKVLAPD